MSGSTRKVDKGLRAKRGLPRHCKACGQAFAPKNNKGRFCSEACQKAQARRMRKEPPIGTAATEVARVGFRSKSPNKINGLSGYFRKPRVAAKTGWQIEAGELVFYPMPATPLFTAKERGRLSRGHMQLKQPSAGAGNSAPDVSEAA